MENDVRGSGAIPAGSVGIVAIGRNEGQRLVACLQSFPVGVPVVYVDSGSTDNSINEASARGAAVVKLDTCTAFTAARARNAGYRALRSAFPTLEFVQFVDGDCTMAPSWMQLAQDFLTEHERVAVVCGRRRERDPNASIYNRLCDIEWDTPIGETAGCGGDALFRVAAFDSVGGFASELVAGEEPELCARLRQQGWKIWRLDAEMTAHDAAIHRFRQWWGRAVRSGYGYAELALRGREPRLYVRENWRAIAWGGILPVTSCVLALVHPAALLGFLLYPAQIVRIAVSQRGGSRHTWLYATFATIAKFAEFYGFLTFLLRRFQGGRSNFDYKSA